MKNKKQTKFEQWVELYGQSRLAERLDVTRQLVGAWVREGARPSDKLKIKIVKLADGMLCFNDFFHAELWDRPREELRKIDN